MSAMQTISRADGQSIDLIPRRSSPKLPEQLLLTPLDRDQLTRWTRAATSPWRLVTRSRIVLLAASGESNVAIAAHLGITRATVALWKARFVEGGPAALLSDAAGRGRKRGRDPRLIARILHARTGPPPRGARWTMRAIAEQVGTSHATVQRVLREHDDEQSRAIDQRQADHVTATAVQSIAETSIAAMSPASLAAALPMNVASSSTRLVAMRLYSRRVNHEAGAGRFTHRKVTA
jgi:transposase